MIIKEGDIIQKVNGYYKIIKIRPSHNDLLVEEYRIDAMGESRVSSHMIGLDELQKSMKAYDGQDHDLVLLKPQHTATSSEDKKKIQQRYKQINNYKKNHVRRIVIEVQIPYYEEVLRPAIEKSRETTSAFIKKAIADRIEREKHNDSGLEE